MGRLSECVALRPTPLIRRLRRPLLPQGTKEERGIVWNDPGVKIAWPIEGRELQLNARDQGYPRLADAPADQLPVYKA